MTVIKSSKFTLDRIIGGELLREAKSLRCERRGEAVGGTEAGNPGLLSLEETWYEKWRRLKKAKPTIKAVTEKELRLAPAGGSVVSFGKDRRV